ncbi:MAG: potassium channel family protein, partial [Bryobacterales bacterium]|nr:potassium channel family protein [Bryobacterales bacterium]
MKQISNNIQQPIRQLIVPMALLVGILLVGLLGFRWIEGASLFDSFYMALITLTTVGYEEMFELSQAGRIFNSILILA